MWNSKFFFAVWKCVQKKKTLLSVILSLAILGNTFVMWFFIKRFFKGPFYVWPNRNVVQDQVCVQCELSSGAGLVWTTALQDHNHAEWTYWPFAVRYQARLCLLNVIILVVFVIGGMALSEPPSFCDTSYFLVAIWLLAIRFCLCDCEFSEILFLSCNVWIC